MPRLLTYLLRRAWTWASGERACLAYRCGRPKISTPSQFCRRHTDRVLYRRGDEHRRFKFPDAVARMAPLTDEELEALNLEIEAGRAIATLRALR